MKPAQKPDLPQCRTIWKWNKQGVRIPAEFQFDTDEVEIFRRDDDLVLRKKAKSLEQAFHLLGSLPADFIIERKDDLPQERVGL